MASISRRYYMRQVSVNNVIELLKDEIEAFWSVGSFESITFEEFIYPILAEDGWESTEEYNEVLDTIRTNIFTILKPYWEADGKAFVRYIIGKFYGYLATMSDGRWNSSIWNGCLNMSETSGYVELLKAYIKYGDYSIKPNGNPVRDAIYSNRLEIATYLISERGMNAPVTISLFQLNNMIGWDPVRLSFLLDHGCKLNMSEKEKSCIEIIQREMNKEVVE